METVWFMIVAVMVAAYVVLDGFDLGAGVIYLAATKTADERRRIMRAIGPVWDGNEVWLLAAGGTLYFAFPLLYASSFSGFYLPLMMVLWLLMLRAIGIEFRTHLESTVWRSFFDVGHTNRLLNIAQTIRPATYGSRGTKIWTKPELGARYIIGCDTSEGGGGDSSGGIVLNRATGEHVASIYGQLVPYDLADELAKVIQRQAQGSADVAADAERVRGHVERRDVEVDEQVVHPDRGDVITQCLERHRVVAHCELQLIGRYLGRLDERARRQRPRPLLQPS